MRSRRASRERPSCARWNLRERSGDAGSRRARSWTRERERGTRTRGRNGAHRASGHRRAVRRRARRETMTTRRSGEDGEGIGRGRDVDHARKEDGRSRCGGDDVGGSAARFGVSGGGRVRLAAAVSGFGRVGRVPIPEPATAVSAAIGDRIDDVKSNGMCSRSACSVGRSTGKCSSSRAPWYLCDRGGGSV